MPAEPLFSRALFFVLAVPQRFLYGTTCRHQFVHTIIVLAIKMPPAIVVARLLSHPRVALLIFNEDQPSWAGYGAGGHVGGNLRLTTMETSHGGWLCCYVVNAQLLQQHIGLVPRNLLQQFILLALINGQISTDDSWAYIANIYEYRPCNQYAHHTGLQLVVKELLRYVSRSKLTETEVASIAGG